MNSDTSAMTNFSEAAARAVATFLTYLPNLVGAIVLILVGWLIARLARAAIRRLGASANSVFDRVLRPDRFAKARFSSQVLALAGNVAFWAVILIFVTAAAETARLELFSSWLDRVVAYLPTFIAGALIVLAGYMLSTLIRDLVAAAASSAGVARSELFGLLAQGTTFVTALVIGIDQIGIDVTFLVTVIAIAVGAILGGLSLAFALGARTAVSNILGVHFLRKDVQPGHVVRIGEVEGAVLELTATSVVVAGPDGRMSIPAKLFQESPSVVLTPEEDDG